jgi:predicted DNA-binding transcriptional regulator AlpA
MSDMDTDGTTDATCEAQAQWLTASQVASLLGCHRQTVWRIPSDDLPRRIRGGRRVRQYSPDDVAAYAARHLPAGSPPSDVIAGHTRMLDNHEARLCRIETEVMARCMSGSTS